MTEKKKRRVATLAQIEELQVERDKLQKAVLELEKVNTTLGQRHKDIVSALYKEKENLENCVLFLVRLMSGTAKQ